MIRDEATQELMFDLNDEGDCREAFAALRDTPIGQKYVSEYFTEENSDSDASKILRAVSIIFNIDPEDAHTSINQLAAALEKVILSGKIRPVNRQQAAPLPVPVAVDTTPKLTGSQQAWKSFREWSDAHSSSECKLRARSDEAYGKFYRTNLVREFAEQPVGDAVEAAGGSQVSRSTQISGPLVEFARLYEKEPVQNLKPKGGMVSLDGRQLTWAQFNEQLEAAIAAGVIR